MHGCWIMCIRHYLQIKENQMPKLTRNASNIGEVWNQYVAMVRKLLSWFCGAHLSRILLQRIKNCRYKLAEISFFIIFDQNLVECMTSSFG